MLAAGKCFSMNAACLMSSERQVINIYDLSYLKRSIENQAEKQRFRHQINFYRMLLSYAEKEFWRRKSKDFDFKTEENQKLFLQKNGMVN